MSGKPEKQSDTFVGLLRGINVGGHNKVPMARLRELCGDLGWSDVQTYIQSGNLVFGAKDPASVLEAALEDTIRVEFGLSIPVIVRNAEDWCACADGNPFPAATAKEPNLVMLSTPRLPPEPLALERLQERASGGERVIQVGDVFWCHFAEGVARSKLTPAWFDKVVGSPVTARNWRTVRKLVELTGRD